ncbi:alpha/beta hydrolase [Parapedobacter deserti]|uniref:Alpha/beta hydrolase n=1 Tax=Parapedobacter deserti TaxID=1912957 RepID=A0ABV7JL21_9SPHI
MVTPVAANSQVVINLYDDAVPNSKPSSMEEISTTDDHGVVRISGVTKPTLTAYLPNKKTAHAGKAVIVCPGGGYSILAIGHEGHDVAQAFAAHGIAAFVLQYRLPTDDAMIDKRIGPLQDAQRAIQLVRERADEWGVAQDKIGVVGFSAGGHLASTLCTQHQEPLIDNPEGTSLRPDFALLAYPVISMKEGMTHNGSKKNLLGSNPGAGDVVRFSNEMQVTAATPPTFLMHAADDTVVPIANSEAYLTALKKYGTAARLVRYPSGGHGFGLHNTTTSDKWVDQFLTWLAEQ